LRAFYPHVPRDPEGTPRTVLELFLARHAMRAATKWMVAIHEAGHGVAYERLGLLLRKAEIRGSAGGHSGWGGTAYSFSCLSYRRPQDWDAAALRREAMAALAGPIAEELLGGGDALGSIGELVDASVLALRAADLEGRDAPSEVVHEILHGTISLVERHAPEILGIGGVLTKRKCIYREDRPIRRILARVPQGLIETGPISERGQVLFDKIMGAYTHLVFLIEGVATDEELAR
jgi:hypothetical protein